MPQPRVEDIAVSGLAVMGQNLVLNLERNGYNVVVHESHHIQNDRFRS